MNVPVAIALVMTARLLHAVEPIAESWDYAPAMKKVASEFQGRPGVVLHVGDSITYANPYGQWARGGEGRTQEDCELLTWMHTGKDDDTDGWWLARADHPAGGRSYTACSGIRLDEILAGGKQQMPPLKEILDQYKPQIIVLMLGTNDASAGRDAKEFAADLDKATQLASDRGIVCILSTIPPHPGKRDLAATCNESIRKLAKSREMPLIDYEQEILTRRPDDWNGTLLGKDDVHPSANHDQTTASSAPTDENLRNSGYLLRGWLSVRKIGEVKRRVLD